jgi:hypothetical protein
VGVELSEENQRQMWVPPGFAHGFLVLSEFADFLYKTTDYYAPEHERCIVHAAALSRCCKSRLVLHGRAAASRRRRPSAHR